MFVFFAEVQVGHQNSAQLGDGGECCYVITSADGIITGDESKRDRPHDDSDSKKDGVLVSLDEDQPHCAALESSRTTDDESRSNYTTGATDERSSGDQVDSSIEKSETEDSEVDEGGTSEQDNVEDDATVTGDSGEEATAPSGGVGSATTKNDTIDLDGHREEIISTSELSLADTDKVCEF